MKAMRTIPLILLAACVLQAQEPFQDPLGVTVDLNGATLMHRSPVLYPMNARVANIQGAVTAQVRLDVKGNVIDAIILSGPDELRATVLQSVLTWHFASDSANATRQVTVTFTIPKGNRTFRFATPPSTAPAAEIGGISTPGGMDQTKLPVHVGDILTPELRDSLIKAVHDYDEHLNVSFGTNSSTGKLDITIRQPGPQAAAAAPAGSVTVSSSEAEANLVNKVTPSTPRSPKPPASRAP